MSFQAKKPEVLSKQLEVQELVLEHGDTMLESVASGDYEIDIGEDIASAISAKESPRTKS